MADISSDIYELTQYIEDIKSKYIDESEVTKSMGIYGYLSEVSTSIMQNSIVMSSEYSNEAIPIKAKFEKNIIAHALSLGINTNAVPATMNILMCIPEEFLLINMNNNKFVFDKNVKIMIGDYEFHTDYDIIILKTELPSGDYVYTAQYDMTRSNILSDITNPYLQSVAKIKLTNYNCIAINCKIRQVEYSQVYKKILTDNPLDNKVMNFEFTSQLAAFNLEVVQNNTTYHITPVYDGLYDNSAEYYCNYSFINSSTIRIKFTKDSFYPSMNCDVTINLYTTKGSEANFEYNSDVIMDVSSDRFNYDRLVLDIKQVDGKSSYGVDKKSIEDLKRIIPKEALSRGSVTNSTDLNNYFNSINNSNCQLNFFKKIDNPLERLYYSYLLLKNSDNNIVPTNTIDVSLSRNDFDSVKNDNYVFNTGNAIFYRRGASGLCKTDLTDEKISNYEDIGFLYFNPFTCIINKSPFYVSYYLTVLNTNKYLSFDFTNQNSKVQFISSLLNWKRNFFTDRNTYKLNIDLMQNISSDMDLVTKNSEGTVTGTDKVKVGLLLYNSDGNPYKYIWGNFNSYDASNYIFNFNFELTTDNSYDSQTSRIRINNLFDLQTSTETYGYLNQNTKAKLFVFVKNDTEGGRDDADSYFPSMTGWTLANTYGIENGLDFFYNYSHIISSNITVSKNEDASLTYYLEKMPVIRYTYMDTEDRIVSFVSDLEVKRNYIEDCLDVLEDSFGIDFKFYNTYGPSNLFYINDTTVIDKTNISLKFKVKFATITDKYIKDYIINDIKEYVENIEDGIIDLHMPNLVTKITTTYRDQLVYFEFVEFNDYGTSYQHIYRPSTDLIGKIPEFLNINTTSDNEPDITLTIM